MVGIVAPASTPEEEDLRRGARRLEEMGFSAIFGSEVFKKRDYTQSDDRFRAESLTEMFLNPQVVGIISARGGYGSSRLLPYLDFFKIAQNPKPFVGFSDITTLHLALWSHACLPSYYGPMVASTLADEAEPYVWEQLAAVLSGEEVKDWVPQPAKETVKSLVSGVARGVLVGGTLCLVAASLGTDYEIDCEGGILVLEDQNEELCRVDRMLVQLERGGKLGGCAGFLLGTTFGREWDGSPPGPIERILEEHFLPLGRPTLTGVPCGHDPNPMMLPLGRQVELNSEEKSLRVVQEPVRRGRASGIRKSNP